MFMEGRAINRQRNAALATILIAVIIFGMVACGGGSAQVGLIKPRATPLPTSTPLPPLPTEPPPGSEQNPIVLALVNTSDAASFSSQVEDLSATLSDESGLVVEVTVVETYGEALAALCSGQAHVISAQAFAYLAAVERQCGTGVYIAEMDGMFATQGQMVTLAGREIFTVKGFSGYRFCRPDANSVNGWIVPAFSLRKNEVNPLTDLFSVTDSGGDEEVIQALLDFHCDAGASALGAEADVPNSGDIRVIETLPPVPNDTILITTQLDERTQQKITDLLDDHKDDLAELIGADGLETSDDTAFDELRQLMSDARVDAASMSK